MTIEQAIENDSFIIMHKANLKAYIDRCRPEFDPVTKNRILPEWVFKRIEQIYNHYNP